MRHMPKQTSPNDNELLAQALAHQKKGDHTHAIGIFQNLLLRHGNHAKLLYLAGNSMLQASRVDGAISLFQRSLANDPNQPDTHLHLGVAYWKLHNYQQAALSYQAAIKANKNYAEAYNNLCMVMQDGFKRFDTALELVNKAIAIRPDYADAYNNRGNVLQALDRYEEALASYDLAIELAPNSPLAHNNRGNALRKLDRLADSMSAYQKAIQLKGDYAEAYCNMGCVLADLGQVADARQFYQQSLTLNPDFSKAHFNLGALAASENNHQLALDCLERSIADRKSVV